MPFVRTPPHPTPVPRHTVDAMVRDFEQSIRDDPQSLRGSAPLLPKAAGLLRTADRNAQPSPFGPFAQMSWLHRCMQATNRPNPNPAVMVTIDWVRQTSHAEPGPPLHELDWLGLAVHLGCSDDLLRWIISYQGRPVTAWALACACRTQWWETTLPLLLAAWEAQVLRRKEAVAAYAHRGHPPPTVPPAFDEVRVPPGSLRLPQLNAPSVTHQFHAKGLRLVFLDTPHVAPEVEAAVEAFVSFAVL